MADQRFLEGLKLFNHREFFECHEVIEGLWLETPPGDFFRDLYKGVIQAAAALHLLQRGPLSGALGLFETSVAYLSKYTPETLGLNVEKLIRELKICFEKSCAGMPERPARLEEKYTPILEYKV